MDCLFCKIVAGIIPSEKIYEDESVLAFYDIAPQAPVHYLVIPKAHIKSVAEITAETEAVAGHIMSVIAKTASELSLDGDDAGYRVVSNCGKDANQSVDHLHFHVLGGRQLSWPPG